MSAELLNANEIFSILDPEHARHTRYPRVTFACHTPPIAIDLYM